MDVSTNSERRKDGKRIRKTFLKICLGTLGVFVLGSIIYSVFAEFTDADHLATAKVEIDVGGDVVEAYANIQVELNDEDYCDAGSSPGFDWNMPTVDVPSVSVPSISLPGISLNIPGFIKDFWNTYFVFNLDCLRAGWRDLVNSFKSAGQAVIDLWFALLHVINCFSFLWCPITGILLTIRDMFLFLFESTRHLTCRILWALHSMFSGLQSVTKCEAYAEATLGYDIDPIVMKDSLLDILFNLVITGLVVGFFMWAENILGGDVEPDSGYSSENSSYSDEGSSTPSTSATSSSESDQETPQEG